MKFLCRYCQTRQEAVPAGIGTCIQVFVEHQSDGALCRGVGTIPDLMAITAEIEGLYVSQDEEVGHKGKQGGGRPFVPSSELRQAA